MKNPEYKYNLKDRLDDMTRSEIIDFWYGFENAIGVTHRTFYNWAAIPFGSEQYIQEEKLAELARYMDVDADDLKNFEFCAKKKVA